MRRRELDELAVYELQSEVELIEVKVLHELLVDKTADIVYFTLNGSLHGVICLGDILHHMRNDMVPIVKKFTYVNGFQSDEARKIFAQKNNIQKIPILKGEKLIGDYSRWDDVREEWIKWICAQKIVWDRIKKYLKDNNYSRVYIVEPATPKEWIKKEIMEILSERINVYSIRKEQMPELFRESEKYLVIMTDEDERRGMMCIEKSDFKGEDISSVLISFSRLYKEVELFDKRERLKHYSITIENDRARKCFSALQQKGVNVLAFYNDVYYVSDYIKKIIKKQLEYGKTFKLKTGEFWPVETDIGKTFFAELLENEDYSSGAAQKEIIQGHIMQSKGIRDYSSTYYNVENGQRKTCGQPETYCRKIYLFGNCIIMGAYLEDQYTIASQLQKKINVDGIKYCVENCGAYLNVFEVLQQMEFHEGDIVIVWTGENTYADIESVDLRHIFEENNIPAEWCLGTFAHVNHKVAERIADTLYCKLKKYVKKESDIVSETNVGIRFEIQDYNDILGTYIKMTYFEKYFAVEDQKRDIARGGLLVDLNIAPELYLNLLGVACIEVDELIVFIPENVEETKYSFEEYISSLLNMTQENRKVKVVSGNGYVPYFSFIPTYYSDYCGKDISVEQAAIDAKIFAQCIARLLSINCRFELKGNHNFKISRYNKVIKKKLPEYGIRYIEL